MSSHLYQSLMWNLLIPMFSLGNDYFRDYSSSGPDGNRGSMPYQYVYSTKFGSYAFNGIDLNPNPGPRRPFNFFGHVDQVREGNNY